MREDGVSGAQVVTLYDQFRTVAGGMSGYSYREILTREDMLDGQSNRCIRVFYRTTDIYAGKEKEVFIRGLHYSQLAEQVAELEANVSWCAQAQTKIFGYLHLRLADCKSNPGVRFNKIFLANQALELLRAWPENLSQKEWDQWLALRDAPAARKALLSSNELHICFSKLDELIRLQLPFELGANLAPGLVSERSKGVELSSTSTPASVSGPAIDAPASVSEPAIDAPASAEWMTVFAKVTAAAAERRKKREAVNPPVNSPGH